ncbi:MAG: head GIN domain-containing protein [Litorimonas sp.]
MMKTVLGAASAMALLLSAQTATAHDVDKSDWETQTYDFTGFDDIRLQGVYDLEIKVGPDYSITVSGPPERMEEADIRVFGDQLILSQEKDRRRFKKNEGLHAVVTLPALVNIDLQGVGSITATGVDSEDFDIDVEGVGSVEISGKCGRLNASLEGVGSLDASGLKCKDVDVSVEGMGSAEVYASSAVDADIEGMGSIKVDGNPKDVKKSKSFMSSIEIN